VKSVNALLAQWRSADIPVRATNHSRETRRQAARASLPSFGVSLDPVSGGCRLLQDFVAARCSYFHLVATRCSLLQLNRSKKIKSFCTRTPGPIVPDNVAPCWIFTPAAAQAQSPVPVYRIVPPCTALYRQKIKKLQASLHPIDIEPQIPPHHPFPLVPW